MSDQSQRSPVVKVKTDIRAGRVSFGVSVGGDIKAGNVIAGVNINGHDHSLHLHSHFLKHLIHFFSSF